MSKKKIIAIILFIFLCLFMFTYAGPGNLELKDIKDSKEPIEDQNKDNNNDKDNKDNIKDDSKENIKVVVKNAPEIIVEPYKVVILYGDDYDIMSGVSLNGEEKLSIKADITSTKELKVGQHIVTYTAEDKNGNKATATRKIIVLDPQGDEDKDGFTNEEEIKNDDPKDPFDPESHPETIAPTIKLLGSNPYRMAVNTKYLEEFVEITLDPHDLITTLDDVKVEGKVDNKTIGEYVITYTIVDRYKKSASVSRTVKVLEDKNNNGIIDEDENHYTIDFECEGRGHLNGTLTYSDILVDLTFDEAQIIIPEAVADTYYELKRWEPLTPNGNTKVIGNATYKAVFGPINDLNNNGIADEEEAHYTVKFEAGLNGSLTGTTVYENILTGLTLEEAGVVSPTVVPNKDYKFEKFSPSFNLKDKVTSDITYVATYFKDLNDNNIKDEEEAHYTVKFDSGLNGSLTGTTVYENILTGLTLEEAGVVSPTVAPNKDYKFEKFSPSFNLKDKVTSDITYVATYFKDLNDNNIPDEKEAHYSVKFISEGNGHLEGKLEYLEVLTGLTLKEANIVIPKVVANTYYELKRWEPVVPTNDTVVSSNITYKAIFGPINDKNNNGIADEEETYKLEIEYVYVNGTKAAETKVEDVVYNMPYSVTSPIIEKYTADRLVVEGTMPNEDLKVTVTYKATNDLNNNDIPDEEEDHYTVKFDSGLNGSLNGTTVYENILTGLTLKEANIVIPEVVANTYYELKRWEPVVPTNDTVVSSNITYKAIFGPINDKNNNGIADEEETYKLEIEYVYVNGTKAAETKVEDVVYNMPYSVTSPIIEKYTADRLVVEGTMPNEDLKVTVTYKATNDLNNNDIPDEEEDHYTVKFDSGLNGSLNGTTVYENILTGLTLKEANVVSPTVIPNAGYKFDGWEPEVLDNTKVTSNLTYTAKYVVDDSTVLTGIILKENPNAQLMFQKNTNINIKDYVYVLKVYKDNHTVVANKDEYVINGFSTSKVGTYQITATLNNLLSNSLNYKIVEESAYPTKFEVKFNDTNKYRETKNSFCTGNCDSIQNTNEVVLDHNFIEITEHYDENIKISNIVVRYTNNTTKSINNKLVLSDSVRWSRVDGLNQYDPVYILESYSSKKEHLLLPTDYTYDNIMTSNIIIDTLDITYTKDNKYTYTITFKYDIASKTFKAIKEV